MSDTISKAVTGVPVPQKKPRQGRSPAFPWIPVQKALERAEAFRIAEGGRPKHFSPTTSACVAWAMGPKTGPALQTIAALGHYGLFEFEGAGDQRKVRLTELALNILLDKQPISAERDALIAQAALKPTIHAELWQKWQDALPSDPTFETFLVRDKGFSEGGARDLISEYKETIKFAKLAQAGIIPSTNPVTEKVGTPKETENQVADVGDLVQVEIGGVLQFEKPVRIRAIQDRDGQKWAFVDGSETGIQMEHVTVAQKGAVAAAGGAAKQAANPPLLALEETPVRAGTRKEVFALEEGDVVLTFPDNLSAASFEDLDGYLKVFISKMRRRAGVPEPQKKN